MSQGGNGTTTTSSLPGWIQPYAEGYLGQAAGVAQMPYTPYQRQRVADLSPVQQSSIQGLANVAGGTPSMQAADQQLTRTLQGGYASPYQESPYFRGVLNQGLADIGEQYRTYTAPDTNSQAVLAGVLGGGDHERVIDRNQRALADRMGTFATSLANQNFDRQASQYENERGRQLQATSAATGLNTGIGQSYMNALNAGDIERRQQQSLLDSAHGDFTEWRGYPQQQLGVFGNALSSLMGGAGRNTTTEGPGADPVSQGLGLMMLSNGMGNKGGSGSSIGAGASGYGNFNWGG